MLSGSRHALSSRLQAHPASHSQRLGASTAVFSIVISSSSSSSSSRWRPQLKLWGGQQEQDPRKSSSNGARRGTGLVGGYLLVVCTGRDTGEVMCAALAGRHGGGGVSDSGSAGMGIGRDQEGAGGGGGRSQLRKPAPRWEGGRGARPVTGYEVHGGAQRGRGGGRGSQGGRAGGRGSARSGRGTARQVGGQGADRRDAWATDADQLAGMTGVQLSFQLYNMARGSVPVPAEQWEGVLVEVGRGDAVRLRGCTSTNLALMVNAVVKLNGSKKVAGHVLGGVVVIDQAAVMLVLDGSFSHQNCSMLAYNFAKLGYYNVLWFPHLARIAGARDWAGIVSQSISNMVYAYALAGHCDERSQALVDDMIVAALPQLQDCKPQEIANLVWGLAKLGNPLDRQQLLERAAAALPGVGKPDASALLYLLLERGAMHQLDRCKGVDFANLLWACGQLKEQHGGGLEVDGVHVRALVGELVRDASRCDAQHISNTFVAVVALGHLMQQQDVDTLVRALVDRGSRVGAQAIANTIWACATAGYTVHEQQLQQLVRALTSMLVHTPGMVKPQAVSNTLWGCATMGCSVIPQHCEALVGWLLQNTTSCKPQGVANTAWVLSKLQPASGSTQQQLQPSTVQLLEALPAFVEANSAGFDPQSISNTALAAATLECHVPGLMAALMSAAWPQLQAFTSQELANLLWAMAVLEPMESQQVFGELKGTVAGRLGSFNEQEVGNTAWVYAVVLGQLVDRQLAMALLQQAVAVQVDLLAVGKSQLYSLVMVLPAELVASQQPEVQRLVKECRAAFVAAAKESAASQVQRRVFQVLSTFGDNMQLQMEHIAAGGLFCIDIAVNPQAAPGQWVAVEVDGPSHYTCSRRYRELGHTVLRRRLLAQHGWRVVSVPVREWGVQRDKAGYLRGLLGLGCA